MSRICFGFCRLLTWPKMEAQICTNTVDVDATGAGAGTAHPFVMKLQISGFVFALFLMCVTVMPFWLIHSRQSDIN